MKGAAAFGALATLLSARSAHSILGVDTFVAGLCGDAVGLCVVRCECCGRYS